MQEESIRGQLVRVLLLAALALFAIPALTYGFVRHAQAVQDREYLQFVEDKVRSGSVPSEEQEAVLAQFRRQGTWAEDIVSADAIEQRLWSAYEAAFAQQHELSLAYRYWPRNEEELAVVQKYFPAVAFSLRKGGIEVSYRGIATNGESDLEWDAVKTMQFSEGSFGDSLVVTLNEKAMVGNKTRKISLSGLGKQKDAFKEALGRYWHRHKVARGQD